MTPHSHKYIDLVPTEKINGTYSFFENWAHPQMLQVELLPHASKGDQHSKEKKGGGVKNNRKGANLDLRNRTKEKN